MYLRIRDIFFLLLFHLRSYEGYVYFKIAELVPRAQRSMDGERGGKHHIQATSEATVG